MKILTISIAAYNVDQYLAETLDSLIDQRYVKDIEVLVIDDGSHDNTGMVAMDYQERYPETIRYIKKENGGHGSTINKGIELASGKYFRIIDGDDYVDRDEFARFIDKLKRCDVDMVVTNMRVVDDDGNRRIDPSVLENGKDPFEFLADNKPLRFTKTTSTRIFGLSTVSVKTYLLQMEYVKITEKCFYVDVEFIIWCIYLSNSYEFWNLTVYMYRKSPLGNNSVSKVNMLKNVGMQEKVSCKLCKLYECFLNQNIDSDKASLIMARIAISVGATIRTYMLMDKLSESKSNIVRFDKSLNSNCIAYKALGYDIFIKYIRLCNYIFVPLIRFAYKIYNKTRR